MRASALLELRGLRRSKSTTLSTPLECYPSYLNISAVNDRDLLLVRARRISPGYPPLPQKRARMLTLPLVFARSPSALRRSKYPAGSRSARNLELTRRMLKNAGKLLSEEKRVRSPMCTLLCFTPPTSSVLQTTIKYGAQNTLCELLRDEIWTR